MIANVVVMVSLDDTKGWWAVSSSRGRIYYPWWWCRRAVIDWRKSESWEGLPDLRPTVKGLSDYKVTFFTRPSRAILQGGLVRSYLLARGEVGTTRYGSCHWQGVDRYESWSLAIQTCFLQAAGRGITQLIEAGDLRYLEDRSHHDIV